MSKHTHTINVHRYPHPFVDLAPKRGCNPQAKRNWSIYKRYLKGEALRTIGDDIGLSHERIRQIVIDVAYAIREKRVYDC